MSTTSKTTSGKRGFAAMSREKHRELASQGGKRAHELGRGHRFQEGEEAKELGRRGGLAVLAARGPEYFAEMGRKGGKLGGRAMHAKRRAAKAAGELVPQVVPVEDRPTRPTLLAGVPCLLGGMP